MEKIIFEINSKKYVLAESMATFKTLDAVLKEIANSGCLIQGIKEIRRSWFFTSFVILKILVPEDKVEAVMGRPKVLN